MSELVKLAVLGDPLRHTRSPDLHRAGCAALGLECEAHALRTSPAELEATLRRLADEGFLGCNLTIPLKEHALDCVARASLAAEQARSVNTIAFQPDGWFGETTDGQGFLDLLKSQHYEPARQRVLLLGAGGAARSVALALQWAGCKEVHISSRNSRQGPFHWGGPDEKFLGWRSREEDVELKNATVVVNCTPLTGEGEAPAALEKLSRTALVIDLTYGPELNPWVRQARALGIHALDGLGLLVFQARRSLSLWLGQEVPLEPLERAVGWPR